MWGVTTTLNRVGKSPPPFDGTMPNARMTPSSLGLSNNSATIGLCGTAKPLVEQEVARLFYGAGSKLLANLSDPQGFRVSGLKRGNEFLFILYYEEYGKKPECLCWDTDNCNDDTFSILEVSIAPERDPTVTWRSKAECRVLQEQYPGTYPNFK